MGGDAAKAWRYRVLVKTIVPGMMSRLKHVSVEDDVPGRPMAKKQRIPHKFQPWIDARKKFRLSDAQIQMARELGLSPKRFAQYADRKDQPWKLPLAKFIETLYEKQFGKTRPDHVQSMEDIAADHVAKRAARKAENAKLKNAAVDENAAATGNIAADEDTAVDQQGDVDKCGAQAAVDEQAATDDVTE